MASGSGRTRGTVSLTHRSIEAFRTAEAPYRISDQRCIGLAVRVAPSGVKTWDLAYRIRGSGKVRRMSLGRVADVMPLRRRWMAVVRWVLITSRASLRVLHGAPSVPYGQTLTEYIFGTGWSGSASRQN